MLASELRKIDVLSLVEEYGGLRPAARATDTHYTTLHTIYHEQLAIHDALPTGEIPIDDLVREREAKFAAKQEREDAMKLVNVRVKDSKPIGILHFGDPHVDDDGTDIATLKKHMSYTRKIDGLYGANIGDTTNAWVGRLAKLYGEQSTSAREAYRLAD